MQTSTQCGVIAQRPLGFIGFGLIFIHLVFEAPAQFLQISLKYRVSVIRSKINTSWTENIVRCLYFSCLALQNTLHVACHVVDFHLQLTFLFLQFLLDSLNVVYLLTELGDAVGLFLS